MDDKLFLMYMVLISFMKLLYLPINSHMELGLQSLGSSDVRCKKVVFLGLILECDEVRP
ncbi:hypothetical protein AXFE_36520 [Acidithrix ferrooxidans]|uniref:Uncharacterized protein n=1 Tax=Acidithrix ferrooxidans TaxID=1280514 RepID=A0A0D8HEM5_9ACTN|nr:hypothetical protein AXFE_36520 [Acidithrix ferrooxidans]